MSHAAIKRLKKEYHNLLANPPDNIIAYPKESNLLECHYCLTGAEKSPFVSPPLVARLLSALTVQSFPYFFFCSCSAIGRRLLLRCDYIPPRLSLQAPCNFDDYPQWSVQDRGEAVSVHVGFPPRNLEPTLVRFYYSVGPVLIYARVRDHQWVNRDHFC
jgi:hypothetical protein